MNRDLRESLAKQTLRIVEDRGYASPVGTHVDLSDAIRRCIEGTRLYEVEDAVRLREEQRRLHGADLDAKMDVVNETTLAGLAARASADVRLRAGDVLGSGTVGTGCLLEVRDVTLGRYLLPGDIVELDVERLGVLRTPIVERPAG